MIYHAGETAICYAWVYDQNNVLVDPSTSMKITITDNKNGLEVNNQSMTKDAVGTYHYDWNIATTAPSGVYKVFYTATDSTRVSIAKDAIEVVN